MTCEVLALLNGADLGFIPSFSVMLSKNLLQTINRLEFYVSYDELERIDIIEAAG